MSRKTIALASLGLLLLSFALYANVLDGPFQFDDQTSILENPTLRQADPMAWMRYWPTRALTYLSIGINFRLGGIDPRGYHVFNVFAHWLVALAAFWMLSELTRTRWPARRAAYFALLAATLFAVHPIQTQAVAYVIQRAVALMALFVLLAIAAALGSARRRDARLLLLAWLCALCAMLAKEPAVVLPLLLWLAHRTAQPHWPARWRVIAPFALAATLPLLLALLGGNRFGNAVASLVAETQDISRGSYLLTQIDVVARYWKLLLLPLGLNIDHDVPWRSGFAVSLLLPLLLHLSLASLAWWSWRGGRRLLALAIAWFYAALLPESSLYPIRDAMYEHRVYLASVGPCALLAAAGVWLWERIGRWALVPLLLVLGSLAALTVQRNEYWADPLKLWTDARDRSPLKARPHMAVGWILGNEGDLQEARRELERAVELDPDYGMAWNNLGIVASRLGDAHLAATAYAQATRLHPDQAVLWSNLASAQRQLGEYDVAAQSFERCLAIAPRHGGALNGLAFCYVQLGRIDEAWQIAQRADSLGVAAAGMLDAIRELRAEAEEPE